ncbi:MAG: hypothetical protein E6L04_05995 [Thaumarchaeota archaeon]|jgi:hypothetical protein|nr:MAG: hypothetical protein E6L04_05995 [Nitrososphaerota archaeon]TLX88691.1 MAG: hypothetical protein E6K97_06725 [Nitrososphaerota archaeon]
MALASIHERELTVSRPVNNQNYTVGQSWGALRKAWKGYRIAKVQNDDTKMTEYANKIRKIQGELNIAVSSFPNLGIS